MTNIFYSQSCSKDNLPEVKQNKVNFNVKNPGTQRKKGRTHPKKGILKSKSMERPTDEFITNEIVLATIPGYAPWPACIIDIKGNTYFVRFFGTDEMFVTVFTYSFLLILTIKLNYMCTHLVFTEIL